MLAHPEKTLGTYRLLPPFVMVMVVSLAVWACIIVGALTLLRSTTGA